MTLRQFLRAHLFRADGHTVEFRLLHLLYQAACESKTELFHPVKFSRALNAIGYRTGIASGNRVRVLNVSLDPTAKRRRRLTLRKGKSPTRKLITN